MDSCEILDNAGRRFRRVRRRLWLASVSAGLGSDVAIGDTESAPESATGSDADSGPEGATGSDADGAALTASQVEAAVKRIDAALYGPRFGATHLTRSSRFNALARARDAS